MNRAVLSRLLAPLLLLITAAVFWPGLSGGFLFDDYPNIVHNPKVQPDALTFEALRTAADGYVSPPIGRPLATISLAIDYRLYGTDPWGYKLTGLLVHLANVLLVWLLARLLVRAAGTGTRIADSAWPAALIALAWAVHPLQVASVLYIVQRMETMALVPVLAGLCAYTHGRMRQQRGLPGMGWIAASGLLAALGFLSKETAILFPAYTLALELTVLRFAAADARIGRSLFLAYAMATTAAVLLFVFVVAPPYFEPGALVGRTFDAGERLLSQGRALVLYLGWMLAPLPDALVFYRDDFAVSRGWLSPPTTLAAFVLLAVLVGAAFALRRRWPLFALGVFWFFAAHLLTSNVFNLELVFEHRNYFALFGVVLACADLVARAHARWGARLPALAQRLALVAVILVLCGLTAMRSAVWGNPGRLALDLASRNPASQRASNDLATLYAGLAEGDANSPWYAKAVAEFGRGAALPGSSPLSEQGMIVVAADANVAADPAWWDSFIGKLRVRPLGAQERSALANLFKQRAAGLPIDDARLRESLEVLLDRKNLPPEMYVQFGGTALLHMHQPELADRAFDLAIEASRRDHDFAVRVLTRMVSAGESEAAQRFLARAENQGIFVPGEFSISIDDGPPPAAEPSPPVP